MKISLQRNKVITPLPRAGKGPGIGALILLLIFSLSLFALPASSQRDMAGKEAAFTSSTIPDSMTMLQ